MKKPKQYHNTKQQTRYKSEFEFLTVSETPILDTQIRMKSRKNCRYSVFTSVRAITQTLSIKSRKLNQKKNS